MTTKLPPKENPSWLGVGAVLAAIGASACCVGPLLLVTLGIGGAWMNTLTSMATVRPYFIILTLIFMGLGYRKLYLIPDSCQEGEASATAPCATPRASEGIPPASMQSCASPEVKHKQRLIFWMGSVLIVLLLAFPWFAPFFME